MRWKRFNFADRLLTEHLTSSLTLNLSLSLFLSPFGSRKACSLHVDREVEWTTPVPNKRGVCLEHDTKTCKPHTKTDN